MDLKEYNRKKKLQFRFRRDVGEQVTIASLPASLIEASKQALKKEPENKFAPEKIEVKSPKRQTHIILNPSDHPTGVVTIQKEGVDILMQKVRSILKRGNE